MKNRFRSFSAQFLGFAVVSLLLSVLAITLLSYVTYKIFDLEDLRSLMKMLYSFFDLVSTFSLYFIILLILLLALLLNYLLTKRTIKRMNAIYHAVSQIRNSEYHVLLPNDNDDALGELEQNINALAMQINETLVQRKEAERSKDDFIVNIAHDLRTPLTSVVGYLSFISEKQLDPEIQAKYAGVALEKAQQLESLIESLFDIAHFSADTIHVAKEQLNLRKFLMQKQDELYPLLHTAGMAIRLALPNEALSIYADGALMARVFDNLINNAIHYAKEGHYIDIVVEKQRDKVRISFITHANPVPADELEKIFDKLYRLEKSRARGTGGTGLGLSISRRIVELHGGTLTARQAGGGTAFDLYLPSVSQPAIPQEGLVTQQR